MAIDVAEIDTEQVDRIIPVYNRPLKSRTRIYADNQDVPVISMGLTL